jgi:mono/diheme cytochrome c family protein
MKVRIGSRTGVRPARWGWVILFVTLGSVAAFTEAAAAWWPWRSVPPAPSCHEGPPDLDSGSWYWMRSPEQEKRVIAALYNRYCLRCHAVDGRGVWDIPDVPDFTNARWQASRSDAQLALMTLQGRGAVMPAFRGTLTLEESWAMARYLRTFLPGSEASRPDLRDPKKAEKPNEELPPPRRAGGENPKSK